MPVHNYGVLKAKPMKTRLGSQKSPHFQILVKDNLGTLYRIAINIESQGYPSNVLYIVNPSLKLAQDKLAKFSALPFGFTPLPQVSGGESVRGLDYIRGDWFDPADMVALPPDVKGPNNDLNDMIQSYLKQAVHDQATIYAFGDAWGPEKHKRDEYFGFIPGCGIHDIHMNQGNAGRWEKDNGTYQDGGLFIHFKDTGQWIGLFLAFQSQSWCTDENGNPIKPVDVCNHTTMHLEK